MWEEREEEGSKGSRSKQTLRVTYKGAEGTRRHTQDSGQETQPHWREATVRAWGAGCGDRKQVWAPSSETLPPRMAERVSRGHVGDMSRPCAHTALN